MWGAARVQTRAAAIRKPGPATSASVSASSSSSSSGDGDAKGPAAMDALSLPDVAAPIWLGYGENPCATLWSALPLISCIRFTLVGIASACAVAEVAAALRRFLVSAGLTNEAAILGKACSEAAFAAAMNLSFEGEPQAGLGNSVGPGAVLPLVCEDSVPRAVPFPTPAVNQKGGAAAAPPKAGTRPSKRARAQAILEAEAKKAREDKAAENRTKNAGKWFGKSRAAKGEDAKVDSPDALSRASSEPKKVAVVVTPKLKNANFIEATRSAATTLVQEGKYPVVDAADTVEGAFKKWRTPTYCWTGPKPKVLLHPTFISGTLCRSP